MIIRRLISQVIHTTERVNWDVLIVGGGPSGLSAGIRLKQKDPNLNVVLLDRGAEIGCQYFSAMVLDPRALDELLPTWQGMDCPVITPVQKSEAYLLRKKRTYSLTRFASGYILNNAGNFLIDTNEFCQWLAKQGEELGLNIYAGFVADSLMYDPLGSVKGALTGAFGSGDEFQPGIEIHATQTILAEGSVGHLTEEVIEKYTLREGYDDGVRKISTPTYALTFGERWKVLKTQPGMLQYTVGQPLDVGNFGGGHIFSTKNDEAFVGFTVGLDYQNPHFDPYKEFQKLKMHPFYSELLQGGEWQSYGAKVTNVGGLYSLSRLAFPGGAIAGCGAGFFNTARQKGLHLAMKSGIHIADQMIEEFPKAQTEVVSALPMIDQTLPHTWMYKELMEVRNFRQFFYASLWWGLAFNYLATNWTRGRYRTFYIVKEKKDNLNDWETYLHVNTAKKIPYEDIQDDRDISVGLANIRYSPDQATFVFLKDRYSMNKSIEGVNAPETRFCPGGVFSLHEDEVRISQQKWLLCGACKVKSPDAYISWTQPEGGSGPNYL